MKKQSQAWVLIASSLGAALLSASVAGAQDWSDPEGGEEGQSGWTDPGAAQQQPPAGTPPAAQPPAGAPKAQAKAPAGWGDPDAGEEAAAAPSGSSDHAKVASGHLAFGFMGVQNVPYGFKDAFNPDPTALAIPSRGGDLSAPMFGLRYWFSDTVGIEGGLGVGFGSSSGDAGKSIDLDSSFALAVHAGVPLALYHVSHATFLLIPEVNFGISDGKRLGTTVPGESDLLSGMVVQAGVKAGAEVHFGFVGMPELAVQAAIGLYFSYLSNGVNACTSADCDDSVDYTVSTIQLGSALGTTAWDVAAASLAVLYYF